MTAAIEISGLTKRFGSVTALDSFDMTVTTGQVHAFLGPNGAGKSTTIRVLLGLLRADAGQVRLLDGDPWVDAVALHRRLAYVPGDVSLWPTLTGGEAIDVLHRLHGGVSRTRRDELVERFALDPTKKGRSYSKGNRQKVALVAALALDVELYVLDEPTSGLDPLMELVFQESVGELRAAGRTVLLSSHILAQVEKLCDTVTIIRDGRAVQDGRLEDLRHLHRIRMTVRLPGGSSADAGTDDGSRALVALMDQPGVHGATREGEVVHFALDREHTPQVLRLLADAGATEVVSNPPSLEELFMSEYGARVR